MCTQFEKFEEKRGLLFHTEPQSVVFGGGSATETRAALGERARDRAGASAGINNGILLTLELFNRRGGRAQSLLSKLWC